jgi:hypothetical protein
MQTTKPQLIESGPIGCNKPAKPGVNRLGAIRLAPPLLTIAALCLSMLTGRAAAIAPLQSPVVPAVATFTWRLEREIPAGRKLTFYHANDVRLTVDGHACPRGWYESECYAPNAASEITIAVWSTREVWTTVLAIVWHGGRVDQEYLTNPALTHRLYWPVFLVDPEPRP